jgi:hypothetical protein
VARLLVGRRADLLESGGMVTRAWATLAAVGGSYCMSVTDVEEVLGAGPP